MARRNKEYYDTTTSLFINSELKAKILEKAEKENSHLYMLADKAFKKLLDEK